MNLCKPRCVASSTSKCEIGIRVLLVVGDEGENDSIIYCNNLLILQFSNSKYYSFNL